MNLLSPAKFKYKKQFKRFFKNANKEYSKILPRKGSFCMKILGSGRLFAKHIETVKKLIIRGLKRKTRKKVNINFFPDNSVTQKSKGLRMGKGKGNVEFWSFSIKKYRIFLEMCPPITYNLAKTSIKKAGKKLPFKVKFFACYF